MKQEVKNSMDMLEKKSFLDCNNGLVEAIDTKNETNACEVMQNRDATDVNFDKMCDTNFVIDKVDKKSNIDRNINIAQCNHSMDNSIRDSKRNIESNAHLSVCTSSTIAFQTVAQDTSSAPVTESIAAHGNQSLCSSKDTVQDGSLKQSSNDNPSDTSSVTSNKENAPPMTECSGIDIAPMSAMTNMVGSPLVPVTTASVQPLPSNMVNKTTFTMETQYMQQQSQIFVFSTELANKAADAYISGHYASIIAFHCAQPGTKTFLEKYPLKVQQFNRQNPAAWLNSLASIKQGGRQLKSSTNSLPSNHAVNHRFTGPLSSSDIIPCNVHGRNVCSTVRSHGQWPNVFVGNGRGVVMPLEHCANSSTSWGPHYGLGGNSRLQHPISQGITSLRQTVPCSSTHHCSTNNNSVQIEVHGNSSPSNGPAGISTLTGVKVPDENLTPEQRQHREEQLAMIRKMHQLLFPEQKQSDLDHDSAFPPENLNPAVETLLEQEQPLGYRAAAPMCSSVKTCLNNSQSCVNDHDISRISPHMFMNVGEGPVFQPPNFASNSVAAEMEWQKLQHRYYEERRKDPSCLGTTSLLHASNSLEVCPPSRLHHLSQLPVSQHGHLSETTVQQQLLDSPCLSPNSVVPVPLPPPPYYHTPRRGITSPLPLSPNASLTLSSPRLMSSPVDPSRQFPHPTQPTTRLPHPSSVSVASSGKTFLHDTPLNSPKGSSVSCDVAILIKAPPIPSNSATVPSTPPSCSNSATLTNSSPALATVSNCKVAMQNEIKDSSILSATKTNSDFASPSSPAQTPNQGKADSFCHSEHLPSLKKKEHSGVPLPPHGDQEPNLMPVPSPQQIQYLNAFDGQELTIQKQPNTSVKELDVVSPASVPPLMVVSTVSHSHFQSSDARSFPNTPGSCPPLENSQDSLSSSHPASAPASIEGNVLRYGATSPQKSGSDANNYPIVSSTVTGRHPLPNFEGANNLEMMKHPVDSFPVGISETNVRFPSAFQQSPVLPHSQFGNVDHFDIQRNHCTTPIGILHSRFINSSADVPRNSISIAVPNNIPPESIFTQALSCSTNRTVLSSSPCIGRNITSENHTHSHLHNLQKMLPPFDGGNKVPSPVGSCSSSHTLSGTFNNSVTVFSVGNSLSTDSQVLPHRLACFDPIASMAAMSESSSYRMTTGINEHVAKNVIAPNISMSNISVSDANINNQAINIELNANVTASCLGQQRTIYNNTPNQQKFFTISSQINGTSGPPALNGAYSTETISSQCNLKNASPALPLLNTNSQAPPINVHASMQNYPASHQERNSNDTISTATNDRTINQNSLLSMNSNSEMCISQVQRLSNSSFSEMPVICRDSLSSPCIAAAMTNVSTPGFNNTNIQLRAITPNTMQYLPARPQDITSAATQPLETLEFFQKFAAPLTNLDNKVPTHNLQYFPSCQNTNISPVHWGVQPPSGSSMHSSGMTNHQQPVNLVLAPMMRGLGPPSVPRNQMFHSRLPVPDSLCFGRPQCHLGTQINSHIMTTSDNHGQPICPTRQMLLSTPDTTQPLPPSIGQSFNYKHSPFYGPTTADPNYAVQFQNFQQQLYATNTRSTQLNSQINGQNSFGSK